MAGLVKHHLNVLLITNKNGKLTDPFARTFKPDLTFTDLNLPDIHGDEVVRLLHGDEKNQNYFNCCNQRLRNSVAIQKNSERFCRELFDQTIDNIGFLKEFDKWIRSGLKMI